MTHVLELVTFRLLPGASDAAFGEASALVDSLLPEMSGFVRRVTAVDGDGGWVDVVEWRSHDEAMAAAKALPDDPRAASFLRMIDGASVDMKHLSIRTPR